MWGGQKEKLFGIELLTLEEAVENIKNPIFVISAPAHYKVIENHIREKCSDATICCFDPTLEILQNRNAETFRTYLVDNFERFQLLHNKLADEFSKITLKQVLKGAVSSDIEMYECISNESQYFPQFIIENLSKEEIFVDIGAFTGDSIQEFIDVTNNNFKKVIAFEPDKNNIEEARKQFQDKRIEFIQKGISSQKEVLYFENENGNQPDEGAHVVEQNKNNTVMIEAECLDNILMDKVTYIKMDIEGMELKALNGCKKILGRDKPKLAISVYHKMEDIIEISDFILKLNLGYNLYLRHYWKCSGTDTILFAI